MSPACIPIGWRAATLRCSDKIRPGGRTIRTEVFATEKEARASVVFDRAVGVISTTSLAASCLFSPRSYTPKRNPSAGILHAPVYLSIGPIDRDPKIFGATLRDWPKVSHSDGELLLPSIPEDRLFAQLSAENEVVSCETTSRTRKTIAVPLPSGKPSQSDPELDDEVPF
jgi:hypothetical protein